MVHCQLLNLFFQSHRKHCLDEMRLKGSNVLFGLPVVLDTDRTDLVAGKTVALKFQGEVLATLEIESAWRPDKAYECDKCASSSALLCTTAAPNGALVSPNRITSCPVPVLRIGADNRGCSGRTASLRWSTLACV